MTRNTEFLCSYLLCKIHLLEFPTRDIDMLYDACSHHRHQVMADNLWKFVFNLKQLPATATYVYFVNGIWIGHRLSLRLFSASRNSSIPLNLSSGKCNNHRAPGNIGSWGRKDKFHMLVETCFVTFQRRMQDSGNFKQKAQLSSYSVVKSQRMCHSQRSHADFSGFFLAQRTLAILCIACYLWPLT